MRTLLLAASFVLLAACSRVSDTSTTPTARQSPSATAASSASPATASATSSPAQSPVAGKTAAGAGINYADSATWLCRPGKAQSPCDADLDATIVGADGSLTPEPFKRATDPKVDCFYVYPTVSLDTGMNSDMNPGEEERSVVLQQFARFGSVCRLFAPMYRQVTLAALNSGHFEDAGPTATAVGDVMDAWNWYLAHDNNGRGVILVGHSQGSRRLLQLLREKFDADVSLRSRLIAAYLAGGAVHAPRGTDIGGDLANIPACRKPDQLHCLVAYSSFSSESPPGLLSLFGRGNVVCVNPAAPGGGSAALHPYFAGNIAAAAKVPTPFVMFKDQVRAECVDTGTLSYLSVSAVAGKFSLPKYVTGPEWGLHLIDVNLAMGDLVALAASQTAAYLR